LGYALKSFESFRKLPDDPNVQTTLGTTGIIESLENTKNKKDILLKKLKKICWQSSVKKTIRGSVYW
jgi:hypothetical protein